MKQLTLALISCFFACAVNGQSNVPNIVSFQGVARDANNNIVADTTISVQLSYTSGLNGTVFFCRQFIQRTDTFGEFTVSITDTATRSTQCGGDSLSLVPWDNGNIYLNVSYESSLAGPFVPLGSIQLGSTYYAFVARQAESVKNFNLSGAVAGQVLQFNGNTWLPSNAGTPPGSITAFAGPISNIPTGWLLCDGTAENSATYPNLYTAIGTSWGNGDGTNGSFSRPDLRGMFLRGVNASRNDTLADPDYASRFTLTSGNTGNNVGSLQRDALQGHVHTVGAGSAPQTGSNNAFEPTSNGPGYNLNTSGPSSDGTNGTPRISSESRPSNAYVYYIIKY